MSVGRDYHEFYMVSRELEALATEKAYEEAKQYEGKAFSSGVAHLIAYRISRKAHEFFGSQLTAHFNSESYSTMISLTLNSRINYFAGLIEGLEATILGQKQQSENKAG